jgi:hypothetical protein
MKDAKYEFLTKPSPYHTKEEIKEFLRNNSKGEKGKRIYIGKGISEF